MTDPLTYLDEVDARAEATGGKWFVLVDHTVTPAQVVVEVDRDKLGKAADLLRAVPSDVTALSKALRAALAVKDGLPHWSQPDNLPGSEFDEGYEAGVLAVVRAIQAALAVNDEGGK